MTAHKLLYTISPSPLGPMLVAQSDKGICALMFADETETLLAELQQRFPKAELIKAGQELTSTTAQVIAHIDNPYSKFNLPLDMQGTSFQQQVWQALTEIPPGTTMSYKKLAEKIGAPSAVRAVAGACAANKIAVIIPCHRVLRSDGSLSGYRWGVERKRNLLLREHTDSKTN